MAPAVVDALLATEDDRFYEHGAADLPSLARAALRNRATGSVQGGSSITQQYVKNLLLSQATTAEEASSVTEQTLDRKIRELRYAVELEKKLTKDQILERYLNTVNFGDGAYGIGAAAQHYFGVPAAALTVPQAALLVGILKSPTNYNPVDNPGPSQVRRDVVLARMRDTGRIDRAAFDAAVATPVTLRVTDPVQGCGRVDLPLLLPVGHRDHRLRPHLRGDRRGAPGPALPRRAHDPHHARPEGDGRGAEGGVARARRQEPGGRGHRRRAAGHRPRARDRDEQALGSRQGGGADAAGASRPSGLPARVELQADHAGDRARARVLALDDATTPPTATSPPT